MGGILGLFLLAICMAKSQGLTIDILRQSVFESPSSLHYRGGDCTWKISGLFDQEVTLTGPNIELMALDTSVEVICEVNGIVLLQADITSHAAVPPPHNVTLDTVNKTLGWEHPFLPQLPPLFELVYGFTITFHVYGRKDGVHMPSLSGPVSNNYIEFASDLDYCAEYEFMVEAVTNISHEDARQNSSSVCGYFIDVPSFRNLSAMAQYRGQYLHIYVTFVLEEDDCPGTHPTFFIVTLEGLGEHRLDINSTHIEDGGGTFLISFAGPLPNICHLEGTIFGGNDAGNCTAYRLQHSKGPDCSSVVMPTGTATTSTVMDPFSSPIPPTDGNFNGLSYIIGVVAGCAIISIAVIVLGVAVVLVCVKHHRAGHHVDPPMQTNQAYVTVVRSSGKIKTQPCPAYELAVIES